MKPANPRILTINGGSSSIKFALFDAGDVGESGMGILPMSEGLTQTHGQDARATVGI